MSFGLTTPPTKHKLLDGDVVTDTTAGTVVRGDVVTGQGATSTWSRLPKGTANQALVMDATATDIAWATATPLEGSFTTWTRIVNITAGQAWANPIEAGAFIDNNGTSYVPSGNLFTVDTAGVVTNQNFAKTNPSNETYASYFTSAAGQYAVYRGSAGNNIIKIMKNAALQQTITSDLVTISELIFSANGKYLLVIDTSNPFKMEVYQGS